MKMISVHDNEIISYEVNMKNHTITITTIEYRAQTTLLVKIEFSEVLAHMFRTELEGSIIFDKIRNH